MKKLLFAILMASIGHLVFAQTTIPLTGWKFHAADSLCCWVASNYNDTHWATVNPGSPWQQQGFGGYNGFAWYRVKFTLPADLKNDAYADSVIFSLGRIDDAERTFLNEKVLGQSGTTMSFTGESYMYQPDPSYGTRASSVVRRYALAANDPRLRWGAENTLVVRVFDAGCEGGMLSSPVMVKIKGLKDNLVFDTDNAINQPSANGDAEKTVVLKNLSNFPAITGKLTIELTDLDTKQVVATKSWNAVVGKESSFTLPFTGYLKKHLRAVYTFTEAKTGVSLIAAEGLAYILTPEPAQTPKINGATVVGVRPGSTFLFRVPVTGLRPIFFSAEGLPAGLVLDSNSGIIIGQVEKKGEYLVKLKAANSKGKTTRNLKIVVGNRLCLTPPMGWNSWNAYSLTVTQKDIEDAAETMVNNGMADHGWTYVNIDDGWQGTTRGADGQITANDKFPDMKAMTGLIHGYGLKAGIYSTPGPESCGGFLGSYKHEAQDIQTFADWGFDYLKYDFCLYEWYVSHDWSRRGMQPPFRLMRQVLDKQPRDMGYSISQWGYFNSWEWAGDSIGGNLWRTSGDIEDSWASLCNVGFNLESHAPYQKPGRWNDPDMLILGHGWFGDPGILGKHASRLTADEQYSHISLWSLLSAPLLLGCDMAKLDAFTLNLLTNDEVIAIDQDPLGKQGVAVIKDPSYQVIVKDLEDGSKAVGLFNLSETDLTIAVPWDALKLSGKQKVCDVWRQKDLGTFSGKFESVVPPHGVVLVKISK